MPGTTLLQPSEAKAEVSEEVSSTATEAAFRLMTVSTEARKRTDDSKRTSEAARLNLQKEEGGGEGEATLKHYFL